MLKRHIIAGTLDDLLRESLTLLLKEGTRVIASKGSNREVTGILLELTDPRARLSRTESRGKLFSALGELCWYLAGSDSSDFITYYIKMYEKFEERGRIHGAYGRRLFRRWKGTTQFENLLRILRKRNSSRRAVLQLFDSGDLARPHEDVPCTCTLQFLCRDSRLHLIVYMRSNDIVKGLPHDVFCFTMLQEFMAQILSMELGTYKHVVGSLHLYDSDKRKANEFLAEGLQRSTGVAMPPIPRVHVLGSIQTLLQAEVLLRKGKVVPPTVVSSLAPYWADLVRLLEIYACKKWHRRSQIKRLRASMAFPIYDAYIQRQLASKI